MTQELQTRTRFGRIGKFKIGPKQTVVRGGRSFEMPVTLDYFRIIEGAKSVQVLYGERPQQVPIYLPGSPSGLSPSGLSLNQTTTRDAFCRRYAPSGLPR